MTPAPKLEPHDLSKFFPPITDDDFDKLAADIKLNGLHQPIVRYQGKILDGNNRYHACELAGIKPRFVDFTGNDGAARNYVISVNIRRRHLSREDRTKIIEMLLKADPTQSNRSIASTANVDHKTVGAVRDELETTGEIPQLETTTGADKKKRKRKKAGSGSGNKDLTLKYPDATNAANALKAYRIFESHLLDAVEDVKDKTDFSQADELAQATIEKVQEKLSEMQPDEVVEAA